LKNVVTPFRVGLLVVTGALFFTVFFLMVRKGGLSRGQSLGVYAFFHDATGLSPRSRVQIAGIRVGQIEDIVLEGTRARVTLRIEKSVGLREDASITKRSESLLGDYVLDLNPGTDSAPPMEEGGVIKRVFDMQGMEAIFNTLDKITGDIQQVTASLRDALGGPKGSNSLEKIVANLTQLSETVDKTVSESGSDINVILKNLEGVTRDVRGVTQGEDANVRLIVENIRQITGDTRSVLATVRQIIGSNEGDLKQSVGSLKDTLTRLNTTLANFQELSEKVKNGDGLAGKLLADDRLGQKLGETVEDVSDFANRLTRLQTQVDVKSEYLFAAGSAKTTLGVALVPKPDKYYLLEVVDDPNGDVNTQYVQNNPPAQGQPATQTQTITSNAVKFSVEFAKRYYFATFRVGIIESSGGGGLDLNFLNDRLKLKTDVFDFSVASLRFPRVRATLQASAFNHIYISGGVDDILNDPVHDTVTNRLISGRTPFVGAGLFFTDDDLKAILPVAPSFKP
jgi:phospholipid/cholesterol/gamma-HCH transport system substrate-binding protein